MSIHGDFDCLSAVKRGLAQSGLTAGPCNGSDNLVEQATVRISLKCPITYRVIVLPARGLDCKHVQVDTHLLYKSPVCRYFCYLFAAISLTIHFTFGWPTLLTLGFSGKMALFLMF